MSYSDDDRTNAVYDPETPMILDVLALQYLHGASRNTERGGNSWSLARNDVYNTFHDSSGVDTIDQSDASEGSYIVLPNLILSGLIKTKVRVALSQCDDTLDVPADMSWSETG